MREIRNKTFDGERALYHLQNALVSDCTFAGPSDGESALKESADITVRRCSFSLRYPLWHANGFRLEHSEMDTLTRAPLWYATKGEITDTVINGIKCLRECRDISLTRVTAVSPEFGWKCTGLKITDCGITSEYALLECRDSTLDRLTLKGKYSFQYTENLTVTDSDLDTKDAFWHAKNVTVRNCRVRGEYLGWYSDGLTLIDCTISGTQPLCYCRHLTLRNCTMEQSDLAFECSEVNADIRGNILSVKNPKSGEIVADCIGEMIREDAVMETDCVVRLLDGTVL